MKVIQADYLMLPDGEFREDMVLVMEDYGTAYIGLARSLSPDQPITRLKGYIIPGLVNAHTHIELSAYKSSIPRLTGLSGFITALQKLRVSAPVDESKAIGDALRQMLNDGIVAAGDIDNAGKWMDYKETSGIKFHHFFERFGLQPDSAEPIIEEAKKLFYSFTPSLQSRISVTPHAPYSCSFGLVEGCFQLDINMGKPLSIHMLESEQELNFMKFGTGPLADMIRSFGIQINRPDSEADDSLKHILPSHEYNAPIIFVHNTYLRNPEQMKILSKVKPNLFLCLCLRANQYIEGCLPDVEGLSREGFNICIGTDSLASNDSLRITDEMSFVKANFPKISDQEIIRWASVNGMRALGLNFSDLNPGRLWHHLTIEDGVYKVSKLYA
jgi:cytosine/adenosine deaminase-related metal-dependent hydrolase